MILPITEDEASNSPHLQSLTDEQNVVLENASETCLVTAESNSFADQLVQIQPSAISKLVRRVTRRSPRFL